MIIELLIIFLLGYLFTRTKDPSESRYLFKLWVTVFIIYSVYMLVVNLYNHNPLKDYFVSVDQIGYYERAAYLGSKSWETVFSDPFSVISLLTDPHPLASFIFAFTYKLSTVFGADSLRSMLFSVVFIDSIIPIYIFKIIKCKTNYSHAYIYKATLTFALISPFLFYASQILRDVHIALLYTIMTYLALNRRVKLRYVWMAACGVAAYLFRSESGLFSLSFFFIGLFENFLHSRLVLKVFFVAVLSSLVILSYTQVFSAYKANQERYEIFAQDSDMSKDQQAVSSMPFPINIIVPVADATLYPTPFWLPFKTWAGQPWSWLQLVLCLFPFYFLPILLFIVFSIIKNYKQIDKTLLALTIISFIYLLANASNATSRRLMAVYPALFCVYLIFRKTSPVKMKKMLKYSAYILGFIYVAYIGMKYI